MTVRPRGTLLVGQSGGPTAVINCSLAAVIREATEHYEFEKVYGMVHGIEGVLQEQLVNLKAEHPQTIERLLQTPASALGSCRHKVTPRDFERILRVFRAHDIRYFAYIGGNDSMDTAQRVSELAAGEGYELCVIGIPKTMDNDLALTDHCPGYGSAARFIAQATMDTGRDLEAMRGFDNVVILETLGRNAGWLAAASALAKNEMIDAPHLVYVPERAFDASEFLADVAGLHRELGYVYVVVSQGIRYASGKLVEAESGPSAVDSFGHRVMFMAQGVAATLQELVARELGLRARALRPSVIGRALVSCVSSTDRAEAYLAGKMAVSALASGNSGSMVALIRESAPDYHCSTALVPLKDVANAERMLPLGYVNQRGNGISASFREYAMPLLGDPLPEQARLAGCPVPKRLDRAYDA